MVESTEFGKLFTCVGVAVGLAQLISNSILLEAYADTVKSDPGFMYLLAAAFSGFALVIFESNLWISYQNFLKFP